MTTPPRPPLTTSARPLPPLPLDEAWPELEAALKSHQNLVLVAEPGAGKTTRFPPLLMRGNFLTPERSKILMLEPRRLAARASAHRIAEEQGWPLGREVGYQVRFENRTSRDTQLQVLTEGLLARRLQMDSELSDVGAVILDEFHERSQHTDLALGLLFELQQLARPDLRLIVMSATLDAEKVARYLGDAPIVRVPGRTFPVEVHHGKRPLGLETGPTFLDLVAETCLDVISGAEKREGDILVFLPGAREIRGVRDRISGSASRHNFECLELHGSLSLEEQDRAIKKIPGRNKIVLATNIAETSLTIDGVGTVIDSGLARVVRLASAGFDRLQLSRISLASAIQRTGRAGRQAPGISYRLWSKFDEASMPPFEQPELLRTDLSEALLTLLSQGVTEPAQFSWFDAPSNEALAFATRTLTDLGLRDLKTGALTLEGREALQLPLPARLSRLVLEALKRDELPLGAKLAALLSEKDIVSRAAELKRQTRGESDVVNRMHRLEDRNPGMEVDRYAVRNVLRVADAIEKSASRIRKTNLRPLQNGDVSRGLSGDGLTEFLLLLAYPDRVCRRRRPKEPAARMVGGRGVSLAPFSTVETAALFLAIQSSEPPPFVPLAARIDAQISVASAVERSWLESAFPHSIEKLTQIIFDDETLAAQKLTSAAFRDLPLEEPHISRPNADEAFPVLIRACRDRWLTTFANHESLQNIFDRLRFLIAALPEEEALSEAALDRAREPFFEEICFGETKLSQILSKPLGEIFVRHLPPTTAKLLSEDAPEALVVPSGSRIRLQYPEARAPQLEVRIQEVFGLRASPLVARGRVSVVMHLLGPNYRPVQVTSDLESFWRTGYTEVRKELRTRYPKHSWPEDPTDAKPEAKGRRRQ